jgi:hypothetical protein
MKFFRYKQVARLNFSGIDDELNNEPTSYYNTKFKLLNNNEINTKLLRFRIDNLSDIKLSQNAKLILESVFISTVEDAALDIKHNSNIILRLKNLNDSNCYNSDNNNYSILFSHCFASRQVPGTIANTYSFERGLSFVNPSPDKLYTFTIPNNFTNNTIFEFELIFLMRTGLNLSVADRSSFYKFQCSFIICDVDEEELISNDSNTVDLSKFKPHFPLKKSH